MGGCLMGFYTERQQMVMDLRSEGYDCHQIARKLEMLVPEVEEIVYGDNDEDIEALMYWSGAHY